MSKNTAESKTQPWPLHTRWTGDIPSYNVTSYVNAIPDLPIKRRFLLKVGCDALELLSRGHSFENIVGHLNRSESVVRQELKKLQERLGARTLAETVCIGIEEEMLLVRSQIRPAGAIFPSHIRNTARHLHNGGRPDHMHEQVETCMQTRGFESRNVPQLIRRFYERGVLLAPTPLPAVLFSLRPRVLHLTAPEQRIVSRIRSHEPPKKILDAYHARTYAELTTRVIANKEVEVEPWHGTVSRPSAEALDIAYCIARGDKKYTPDDEHTFIESLFQVHKKVAPENPALLRPAAVRLLFASNIFAVEDYNYSKDYAVLS